jgi:hypothetical protein
MATIDYDRGFLKSQAAPSTAQEPAPVHGVICVSSFIAFWVVFLTAVWALHALVDKLF